MIAKAATISHGSNAIRYSVNKDRADIVKTNLLPDDISPEAMFKRMMLRMEQRQSLRLMVLQLQLKMLSLVLETKAMLQKMPTLFMKSI